MTEYKTLVIVDSAIHERVELYKTFLKKSEFGMCLDDVCFINGISADSFLSAEMNGVCNCMFMYGLINSCEDYSKKYAEIENIRKNNPNPTYYMLFCQKKYITCGPYSPAGGSDQKTFSIGVIENEEDDRANELGILKLLAMTLAFCENNSGASQIAFDNYYETAAIELNIINIYFSILHVISRYAEIINEKNRQIKEKGELIDIIRNKKPKACTGNFPEDEIGELSALLMSFSEHEDVGKLRQNMEFVYNKSSEALKKNTAKKIKVARNALAVADKYVEMMTSCDRETILQLEQRLEDQPYMTITDVEEKDAEKPDALLDRVGHRVSFDFYKFRNLAPLAENLGEKGSHKPGKVFLAAVLFVLSFVLGVCSVYAIRYFMTMIPNLVAKDILISVGVPAALMALTGIIALIVAAISGFNIKKTFRDFYDSLGDFLRNSEKWCEGVRDYINRYLSVYYNYHVKYARIAALEDDIKHLEADIERMHREIEPYERIASLICSLSDEDIEKRASEMIEPSARKSGPFAAIERQIGELVETNVEGMPQIVSPWISHIRCGVGNINGGAQ